MENSQVITIVTPEWARGKNINERLFCEEFRVRYNLIRVEGEFYTTRGRMPEEQLRKLIYDHIYQFYTTGLAQKVNLLLEALKLECSKKGFPEQETLIHCANGTYDLDTGQFRERLEHCRHRLPVAWEPEAPEPKTWLWFLGELLRPEDILTLQEYFGYCLLPVNYAQKMLMIIGAGGEGKSRIGIIAQALLGDAMANGSLTKLEGSPFARADLQGKLLMVDDDLQLEALTTTGRIKTIITAEQPLDLERKGVQSYQARLYCRLMAFGNGSLQALHDRSHGFFRRQIILTTLPRPADRVDDPYLAKQMKKELPGILKWAMEGLQRLMLQNMQFTISGQAWENLRSSMAEGCNIMDFMDSEGYFRRDVHGQISSRKLNALYREWCDDNAVMPLSSKTLSSWLMANADTYAIRYTTHIPGGNGRHVRGFRGIRAV